MIDRPFIITANPFRVCAIWFLLVLSFPLSSGVVTQEIGKLSDGTPYSVLEDPASSHIHIQLIFPTGTNSETEETKQFHLLLARTLFWGNKTIDRSAVLNTLQAIGIDGDPERLVHVFSDKTMIQLTLPNSQPHLCTQALQLLQMLANSPSLSDEALEIEREKILTLSPESPLKHSAPSTIRDFYFSHMRNEFPGIHLESSFEPKTSLKLLKKGLSLNAMEVLGTIQLHQPFDEEQIETLELFLRQSMKKIEKIEIDGLPYLVVDHKILMRPPSFYQTHTFYTWCGWSTLLFSIASLGGMIWLLSTPFAVHSAWMMLGFASSILSFGTSIYTFSHEALRDPATILSIREKYLNASFTSSFQAGYIPFTLTPLEARQQFILEHTHQPNIELINSTYNPWTKLFDEMLMYEELCSLKNIVNSYRAKMNDLISFNDRCC